MTELCGPQFEVETYIALKGPLQCKHCQCHDSAVMHPGMLLLGRPTFQGSALPQSRSCGENFIANYRDCVKWKEAKAIRRCLLSGHRLNTIKGDGPPSLPAMSKVNRVGSTAEQKSLGPGRNHAWHL